MLQYSGIMGWSRYWHMVLDMDNLHFSKEFLEFPVQGDTDICVHALGFLHDTAWKNLDRNSVRIRVENGENKSLVKLSQFCYSFKDIRTYRKSR